jgi:MoxR-like ATPase
MLAGKPDVEALRELRKAGIFVLLYGPPGTGKTALAEAAFPDIVVIAGDGSTTVDHFVGQYVPQDNGRYEWVEGPLVTAMREGRPLFIDDATLIPPSELAVVYPVMDGHTELTVKGHTQETVTAAPGFYVIGGHNPNVHGAVLTDALNSRFAVQIEVSSDYDLAEQLGINGKAIRVARNLSARRASGEIGWAPQTRQLVQFAKIAEALGDEAAAANIVSIAPEDDREIVATVVRRIFGKDIPPLALGPRI